MQYVSAARLWPEKPGVGKPYNQDIDERLEDWLAYESYTKQGNEKAAKEMLDKILLSSRGNGSSINSIITAWALQKTGKNDQAKKLLNDWAEKEQDKAIMDWARNAYNGEYKTLPGDIDKNENFRVLDQWLKFKSQH
ncbi:MAG: hypothetical protein WKG06_31755 [Segetibacter sp.]